MNNVGAKDEEHLVLIGDEATAATEKLPVIDDGATAPDLPEGAELQNDGTVLLTLLEPVTLKYRRSSGETREEPVDKLLFHRLRGADLIAIQNTASGSKGWVAIARSVRMSELKMKLLFERMDGADAMAASQIVGFFLERGHPIGR